MNVNGTCSTQSWFSQKEKLSQHILQILISFKIQLFSFLIYWFNDLSGGVLFLCICGSASKSNDQEDIFDLQHTWFQIVTINIRNCNII